MNSYYVQIVAIWFSKHGIFFERCHFSIFHSRFDDDIFLVNVVLLLKLLKRPGTF